jgi:hypothetical protein
MRSTRRLAGQPPATGLPITPPIVPIGAAPPSLPIFNYSTSLPKQRGDHCYSDSSPRPVLRLPRRPPREWPRGARKSSPARRRGAAVRRDNRQPRSAPVYRAKARFQPLRRERSRTRSDGIAAAATTLQCAGGIKSTRPYLAETLSALTCVRRGPPVHQLCHQLGQPLCQPFRQLPHPPLCHPPLRHQFPQASCCSPSLDRMVGAPSSETASRMAASRWETAWVAAGNEFMGCSLAPHGAPEPRSSETPMHRRESCRTGCRDISTEATSGPSFFRS